MLDKLRLKFGAHPGADPLEFDVGQITVFVGPNYSGKSKLIREVQWAIQYGHSDPQNVLVDRVQLSAMSPKQIKLGIEKITLAPSPGELVQPGHILVGRLGSRQQVSSDQLINSLMNYSDNSAPQHIRQWAGQWYYMHMMRLLDGQSRIALSND